MPELMERELTYRIQGWLEIRHADDEIRVNSLEKIAKWLDDLLLFYRNSPLIILKDILNVTLPYWQNQKDRYCIVECVSRFLDASFQHDITGAPFSDPRMLEPAEKAAAFIPDKQNKPFKEQEKKIAYRLMGYLELAYFMELSNKQIILMQGWFTKDLIDNSSFLKSLNDFLESLTNIPVPAKLKANILRQYLASFFIRNIDPFYEGNPEVLTAIHMGTYNQLKA